MIQDEKRRVKCLGLWTRTRSDISREVPSKSGDRRLGILNRVVGLKELTDVCHFN